MRAEAPELGWKLGEIRNSRKLKCADDSFACDQSRPSDKRSRPNRQQEVAAVLADHKSCQLIIQRTPVNIGGYAPTFSFTAEAASQPATRARIGSKVVVGERDGGEGCSTTSAPLVICGCLGSARKADALTGHY